MNVLLRHFKFAPAEFFSLIKSDLTKGRLAGVNNPRSGRLSRRWGKWGCLPPHKAGDTAALPTSPISLALSFSAIHIGPSQHDTARSACTSECAQRHHSNSGRELTADPSPQGYPRHSNLPSAMCHMPPQGYQDRAVGLSSLQHSTSNRNKTVL